MVPYKHLKRSTYHCEDCNPKHQPKVTVDADEEMKEAPGLSAAPPLAAASSSSSSAAAAVRPSFLTHSWALLDTNSFSSSTAAQWMAFYSAVKDTDACVWIGIRGEVGQYDTASTQQAHLSQPRRVELKKLRGVAARIFRADLLGAGVDDQPLKLATLKILRAAPGAGRQPYHLDAESKEVGDQRYSCLMYLVDTLSTSVPKLPFAAFDEIATPHVANALCRPENFLSAPVVAGQRLVFSSSVCHHGVKNESQQDRVILFALFSPTGKPMEDDTQFFPLGASPLRPHPC
jgi:hypothetical protein